MVRNSCAEDYVLLYAEVKSMRRSKSWISVTFLNFGWNQGKDQSV